MIFGGIMSGIMKGSIFKKSNSQFYQAQFFVWDRDRNGWKKVSRTTKCTNKKAAQAVLDGFIATAQAASKFPAGTVLSKDYVEGVVISILGSAGIDVGDFIANEKTIGEYFGIYLARIETKKSRATLNAYTSYYEKLKEWLKDNGGSEDSVLSWLTLSRMEDYYVWLLERMTAKSANERINLISRILNMAVAEELLLINPAGRVQQTKKTESLDREPFTVEEAMTLIDWLIDNEPEWAKVAMMGFMAGCRISDAAQMPRSALVDGVLRYKQHKTDKWLRVPLVVERYKTVLENEKGEFIAPDLALLYQSETQNKMSSHFTKFVTDAGITQIYHPFKKSGRNIARKTFHSLRHTLRSAIVAGGGSDAQADSILGHSPGEGKRYTHSELKSLEGVLRQALDD